MICRLTNVVVKGSLAAASVKASRANSSVTPSTSYKTSTWLNLGNPVFNATLTFTLTHLKRLLRNRLIRKNSDKHSTATLQTTRQRPSCRFNLPGCDATTHGCFQAKFTKTYFATTLSKAAVSPFELLAKFCALRL
jgi:hypothetical protein